MADSNDNSRLIDVSTPSRPNTFVVVDAGDFERLNAYSWHLNAYGRACRRDRSGSSPRTIQLHHEVFGCGERRHLKFANGNPLDCRRANLAFGKSPKRKNHPPADQCPAGARLIDISTKKFPAAFAVVDADIFDHLTQWSWHRRSDGYAARNFACESGERRVELMHRAIMVDCQLEVDHIDGDRLNNRRANLRVAQHAENSKNLTGYAASGKKGAHLIRETGRYRSSITVDGNVIGLGVFGTPEEAHAAYAAAASEHHGAFSSVRHKSET